LRVKLLNRIMKYGGDECWSGYKYKGQDWKWAVLFCWSAANKNIGYALIKFYFIIISKISLMSFDPKNFVSPYITVEEVLEIKKAFDYFDRDLGGAIDPKGTAPSMQNSKWPSTRSVSRPRPRPFTR